MIFAKDSTLDKLVILFVLEKMEIPLTENSITDICCADNGWVNYMDCKDALFRLVEANLIYKTKVSEKEDSFTITYEGRNCLLHFYRKIPLSLREQMQDFIADNRMEFKRAQEYVSDFVKNDDGSYTVTLKIRSPLIKESIFEINIKAPSHESAMECCNRWQTNAHSVYEHIYESLIENG
ncbi:MAG: DUF4364 family protein [Clostridia bacterium]